MKQIGKVLGAQLFNGLLLAATEKGMFFWRDDGWVEMDLVAKDREAQVRAPVDVIKEPLADG